MVLWLCSVVSWVHGFLAQGGKQRCISTTGKQKEVGTERKLSPSKVQGQQPRFLVSVTLSNAADYQCSDELRALLIHLPPSGWIPLWTTPSTRGPQ